MWSLGKLGFGAAFAISLGLNGLWATGHTLTYPGFAVPQVRDSQNTPPAAAAPAEIKPAIHRKAHVQQTVKRVKPVKMSTKANIAKSKRTLTKVQRGAEKPSPIVLSKHKLNQAAFDCSSVPAAAYQYPPALVVKTAASYGLSKSLLSKLQYCLEKRSG